MDRINHSNDVRAARMADAACTYAGGARRPSSSVASGQPPSLALPSTGLPWAALPTAWLRRAALLTLGLLFVALQSVALQSVALPTPAQAKPTPPPAAARAADGAVAPAVDVAAKKAWGVLVSEDGKTRIALTKDRVIVGSSPAADARIEHASIIARHAEISHESGVVYVKDLGARFGTLAAGTELKKGQRFRIVQRTLLTFGAISYVFEFGDRDVIPPTMAAPKGDAAAPKGKQADDAPTAKAKSKSRAPAKKPGRATKND